MKSSRLGILLVCAIAVVGLLHFRVHAQSGGPYTVTWSSTTSGGASGGGAYTLNAMLSSQGTSTSSGGGYTLGDIWAGAPEKLPRARLPIVVR